MAIFKSSASLLRLLFKLVTLAIFVGRSGPNLPIPTLFHTEMKRKKPHRPLFRRKGNKDWQSSCQESALSSGVGSCFFWRRLLKHCSPHPGLDKKPGACMEAQTLPSSN